MRKLKILLMAVSALMANVAYAQEVTESDLVQDQNGYYLIDTPEKLVYIANFASNEKPDINIKITADLDMKEVSDQYSPIRNYSGIFDGGCHTISNLVINKPGEKAQALIGVAGECTIKNLTLDETCSITGGQMCAGFVAVPSGSGAITMENLVMQGNVKGERNAAGIFACNEGAGVQVTMTNCGVSGHIEGGYENGAMSGWFGGKTTVSNCWFVGTIEGHSGENDAFGRGSATLTNCYSVIGQKNGVTNISTDAAASGELTWKLNGHKSSDIIWYQTLGEDLFPVLNNAHKTVYANGEFKCDGSAVGEVTYNNEGGSFVVQDHEYTEMGVCGNCGHAKEDFVYLVDTPEKLVYIANFASNENPGINIKITADLDMKEVSDQYSPIRGYSGTFDGGCHTISNLVINNPDKNFQGLIGEAGNCTIKNLTLDETCSVTGAEMCGGFVGATSGQVTITMENLVMNGDVTASRNAAGIFGCNNNSKATVVMTNCGVSGHIKEGGWYGEPGAMSGWFGNNATVTNCWFLGTIEGYNNENDAFCRGGATLTNCYSVIGQKYGVTNISTDAAASGDLTWKLNGEKSTDVVWYQTIGKDQCPSLDPTHGVVVMSGESYASQKTVNINISAEDAWATYIQPFDMELPAGLQAFTADGVNGEYLVLTEATSLKANTPYILYAENGFEETVTAFMSPIADETVTGGILSGALDAQRINSGYVLQNQGNGSMFYKVNSPMTVPVGKCWLSITNEKKAIRLFNGATGIDGIANEIKETGVYSLDGKAVANPQSGKIYIVNGKKVMKL